MLIDMTTSGKVSTSSHLNEGSADFFHLRSPDRRVQKGHNVAFISWTTANTLQYSYTISDINILDINI